jgi:hypothetical protein
MTDSRDPQQPALFLDSLGRRQQPRWLAAAERRAVARRAFEALPDDEKIAIYARIDRLLFGPETTWKIARSMPNNPHSYCHRRNFKHDDDFCFLIETFRAGGVVGCERQKFHGRWYDTFVRAHPITGVVCRAWCMGWPLNMANGGWLTVIINRTPVLETDL